MSQLGLFSPQAYPVPEHVRSDRPLSDARASLFSALDDGTVCPCCDKWCKRYKRGFNATMARGLIWLVLEAAGDCWVNVQTAPNFVLRSKQLQTTRLWGLVEPSPDNEDATTKSSGLWRPTAGGVAFVHLQARIPRYVYEYRSVVQATSDDDTITIVEALGEGFDYRELMRGGA